MHIVTAMPTTPRFLSNVAGVVLSLALSGLCACAPESEGTTYDRGAPLSESAPPPAVSESEPSDPSATAAPPAPVKEITPIPLYTVSGTTVPAREGYQADIARAVDPKYYQWIPIEYPAALFPMSLSMDQGVSMLIDQIKSRPGKFALVGFSQGGAVISRVYNELRAGSLQSRRGDLIAGVAMGNPMRELGHTIPGGTDPGGRGIMATQLAGSEALWWDFCNANDIACSVPNDVVGQEYSQLFGILYARYDGRADPVQLVISVLQTITNPLTIITEISALTQAIQGVLSWALPGGTGTHGAYPFTKPIPGDDRTSMQLAVDYLNQTAAAQ